MMPETAQWILPMPEKIELPVDPKPSEVGADYYFQCNLQKGRFLIQRCTGCRRSVFFPRIVWRLVRNWGRTRPDMAEGCTERFDLEFWRYAWRYAVDVLPRREARLAASGVPVIDLRSPGEAEAWLAAGAPLDIARAR